MVEIIPAIMPETIEELESAVSLVRGVAKWVQVDVMDGKFVPEQNWPFPNFLVETAPLIGEDRGLPFWEDVNYEFDLMIGSPEKFAEKFVAIGGGRIIIHYESAPPKAIWDTVKKVQNMITEVGIAIDTTTPNEVLDEFFEAELPVDFVQFMGIAKIGYQGQPFDNRVIPKIKAFKTKYPDIMISVDGGVNFDSAPTLIEAGANRLVSGSAIFTSGDAHEAIRKMENPS